MHGRRPASSHRIATQIVAFAVALNVTAPVAWATSTYSLRVLGTLAPGNSGHSFAESINDAGAVVGGATDISGERRVFRWTLAGGMTNNGTLQPPYASYGLDINSAGVICGVGYTQPSGFAIGFYQVPAGSLQALPSLSGAGDWYAYAIAESGVTVGWSNTNQGCGSPTCFSNPGHAVKWSASGALSLLPDLLGYCSAATDITPDGSTICGYGGNLSGQIRAFRLTGIVATELPPLAGYDESRAYGVNTAGQVVGVSIFGTANRATLWNATTPLDLGTVPGANGSIAWRISESGVIIGYVTLPGPEVTYRAMTFEAGNPPTDLNTTLDQPSAWTLLYCMGINSGGQIVGAADSSGVMRACVLTPAASSGVPPAPASPRVALREPAPNPAARGTWIDFSLAAGGHVELSLVDIGGRLVARVVDQWMDAGDHAVAWGGIDDRGRRVPPGLYLIRMTAGGRVATRKLIVRG